MIGGSKLFFSKDGGVRIFFFQMMGGGVEKISLKMWGRFETFFSEDGWGVRKKSLRMGEGGVRNFFFQMMGGGVRKNIADDGEGSKYTIHDENKTIPIYFFTFSTKITVQFS